MIPEPSQNQISQTCFPSLLDRVLVLTGPTAAGKTQLALRVAETLAQEARTHGHPALEIVSLDSITVYRRMDIGTAKATPQQRQRVPHHLIDIIDPDHEFSVAEYLTAAHRCVAEIEARGNRAMFVGGTPMYLKAILRGFDAGPPADQAFRHAVIQDLERFGIEALRKRLEQVDPLSAARIDAQDARRMIRALEFARHTGTPISHRQVQFDVQRPADQGLVFAIEMPRSVLHQRIQDRVRDMFASGLVGEIQALLKEFPVLSKTARTAVGYREVLESDVLESEVLESDVLESDVLASEGNRLPATPPRGAAASQWDPVAQQVLFHTRRLARRQETWLRSFSEIRPLVTHEPDGRARTVDELASEMLDEIRTHRIWAS